MRAVAIEAKYREDGIVLDVAAYDILRRENSAVRCCFGLIGYMLGEDLPDAVYEHPTFQQLHFAAVDMVTWSNVGLTFILCISLLLIVSIVLL